ncbi:MULTISPECIES: YdeI/OmpD-associated family protein [unclassified Yoonia]|uniref:YdeI/OmpD-associated family protein n=1 Tax=unclassified Yoonia TaxID=2629118 RepID=UPI002AFE40C7|nr:MULTISPECIES: YdeI/OmpD-associated family protein [unclassified Yoonia]
MMITQIADYFDKGCGRCARFDTDDCAARLWQPGLRALRDLCLAAGLQEVVKWGHPCYMHKGRNIAIIGATRAGIRLSFFNAALMRDPHGVLERQGPNTQHADMIALNTADDAARLAPVITAYLAEAAGYAEAGIKPAKNTSTPDLPTALVTALDDDPALAEAFAALTPGRQKSYVLMVNGAKAQETKMSRIAKARDKILSGKGAQER